MRVKYTKALALVVRRMMLLTFLPFIFPHLLPHTWITFIIKGKKTLFFKKGKLAHKKTKKNS